MPDRIRWRWTIPLCVGLEAILMGAAVAWITLYSYVLRPGQLAADYDAYAQWAAPIVSVIVGPPLFYVAGAWLRRRLGADALKTVTAIGAIYAAIDVVLLAVLPDTTLYLVAFVVANSAFKLAAGRAGARQSRIPCWPSR